MRNSPERLKELHRLLVLDSQPERQFDEIAQRLAAALEVPFVMVNFLAEDRDWFKASVGMPRCESSAQKSMCNIFFESEADVVVVADTLTDARFANHPFVTGEPKIRFYAATRLVSNGQTVGTLCAYDTLPKTPTAEQRNTLITLTAAVAYLLSEGTNSSKQVETVASG